MDSILYPAQLKYLEKFHNESDPLILEMEAYAKENKVPILYRDSARLLELLIKLVAPHRVLELGTAIGYSTIRIARNLKKKSVIHTIEKSEDNIAIAKENFTKSGLEDKIILYEGNALEIMPRLDKKYDFIFLDADKGDYKRLFDYSMIFLKKGGILFIDNLLWHGFSAAQKVPANYRSSAKIIREFNQIFTSQPSLRTTILPVGDGIGIGLKE